MEDEEVNQMKQKKQPITLRNEISVRIPLRSLPDNEVLGYVTLMGFTITLDLEAIDKKTRTSTTLAHHGKGK